MARFRLPDIFFAMLPLMLMFFAADAAFAPYHTYVAADAILLMPPYCCCLAGFRF